MCGGGRPQRGVKGGVGGGGMGEGVEGSGKEWAEWVRGMDVVR